MTLENPVSGNRENLKQISKIHFLVHPGFLADLRETVPGETTSAIFLLNKYLEQARNLKENELMFAFTHTKRKTYKKDIAGDLLYIKNLEKMKEILGRRLIILSDDFYIFGDPEVMKTLKNLAEVRGYTFDENVLSEAYGETLDVCVPDAAQELNRTGNLTNKTVIKPELTDYGMPNVPKENTIRIDNYKKRISSTKNRLTFE